MYMHRQLYRMDKLEPLDSWEDNPGPAGTWLLQKRELEFPIASLNFLCAPEDFEPDPLEHEVLYIFEEEQEEAGNE